KHHQRRARHKRLPRHPVHRCRRHHPPRAHRRNLTRRAAGGPAPHYSEDGMKKRLLWPGLVVGVAAVALGAQMLSGLGGNGGPPPAPLTEQAFFEDDVAPAHTPAQYDLTIVIYSDYQCGYCRQLDASMQKLLQEDPRIRVIYRDWPLLGHGSAEAARAAIASQWQG